MQVSTEVFPTLSYVRTHTHNPYMLTSLFWSDIAPMTVSLTVSVSLLHGGGGRGLCRDSP